MTISGSLSGMNFDDFSKLYGGSNAQLQKQMMNMGYMGNQQNGAFTGRTIGNTAPGGMSLLSRMGFDPSDFNDAGKGMYKNSQFFLPANLVAMAQGKSPKPGAGGGGSNPTASALGARKDPYDFSLDMGNLGSASSVWDPATKQFKISTNGGDSFNQLTDSINSKLADAVNGLDMTPAGQLAVRDKYENAFYDRVSRQALTDYNTAMGDASQKFNARGALNSVGFADYATRQLGRNLTEANLNAREDAVMASQQLASNDYAQRLQGIQTMFGGREAQQAYGLNMADFARLGFEGFNQTNLNSMLERLKNYQTKNEVSQNWKKLAQDYQLQQMQLQQNQQAINQAGRQGTMSGIGSIIGGLGSLAGAFI